MNWNPLTMLCHRSTPMVEEWILISYAILMVKSDGLEILLEPTNLNSNP